MNNEIKVKPKQKKRSWVAKSLSRTQMRCVITGNSVKGKYCPAVVGMNLLFNII